MRSLRMARSPADATGIATDLTQPTPLGRSIAAGCPSVQRATTSAPRNESTGYDQRRSNAETTRALSAETPPMVSTGARGTAPLGRLVAGHSISAPVDVAGSGLVGEPVRSIRAVACAGLPSNEAVMATGSPFSAEICNLPS